MRDAAAGVIGVLALLLLLLGMVIP